MSSLLSNDTVDTSAKGGLLISLYQSNPTSIILVLSIAAVLGLFIYNSSSSIKANKVVISEKKPTSYQIQKNRKYGHWIPDISFKTPIPEPFKNWDYKLTKPIPYRAFKHKYNITMGIRSMDWNSWIELDNEWPKYHQDKLDRLAEKGDELHGCSPKAIDASFELLQELKQFLPNRYPTLFKETEVGLDNLQTKESFDFRKGHTKEDQMVIISKLLQDDIAIMIEHEDGNYSLEGGAIILAGFWRLKDKFQLKLNEIHTSGDVPQYQEKLQNGMTKFFQRLTCDKPVVRNNYFIQTDDNLGWSQSIGDENSDVVGWYTAEVAKDVNKLYFRSERQSLRRLPISGAVIFTIRTYFVPIVELCHEPYIPRRLLNGINTWSDDVEEYKGYHKYKDVLLPYLEAMAQEQEANGLPVEEEPNVYPF
ncbi:hypothetical protein DFJ63DRAFT_109553 [Scheffersomyces coipomensis]|uniref:uncharacterized protein n=1 Tax=Scheffersomyces coipomensis TaxID=1788519 RepID=UPI00315D7BC2